MMLIVEDHATMRRLLREFVQAAYPEVSIVEAADGESAIAACEAHEPAIVLMDIGLPDASGIDLTARIKRHRPQCVVIIVSQHAEQAYVEGARAAGAFAYVTKDEVDEQLIPAIRRALEAGM